MNTPRRFRPTFELLESRLTPSGVTAALVGGNLTITDAVAHNALSISQPVANEIVITDASTSINGMPVGTPLIIKGVTGNITINLAAGDSLSSGPAAPLTVAGNLIIDGNGGNAVSVSDATIKGKLIVHISGSSGDSLTLTDVAVKGTTTISISSKSSSRSGSSSSFSFSSSFHSSSSSSSSFSSSSSSSFSSSSSSSFSSSSSNFFVSATM